MPCNKIDWANYRTLGERVTNYSPIYHPKSPLLTQIPTTLKWKPLFSRFPRV